MGGNSVVVLTAFFSFAALAASPGDKRTILTSGGRVHTIRYELGQSTVLYFGMKPDTVICGNKNYFNIEKIKEGITIQPLSNFSTNLTVLTQEKRFLFFLTPAKGGQVDTFVDVRWVPEGEARAIAVESGKPWEVVRELNQKLRLGSIEVRLRREIRIESARRSILEFEAQNLSKGILKTSDVEVLVVKNGRPLARQVSVFERDEVRPGEMAIGRLIVTGSDLKTASISASYRGESGKIQLRGGGH